MKYNKDRFGEEKYHKRQKILVEGMIVVNAGFLFHTANSTVILSHNGYNRFSVGITVIVGVEKYRVIRIDS